MTHTSKYPPLHSAPLVRPSSSSSSYKPQGIPITALDSAADPVGNSHPRDTSSGYLPGDYDLTSGSNFSFYRWMPEPGSVEERVWFEFILNPPLMMHSRDVETENWLYASLILALTLRTFWFLVLWNKKCVKVTFKIATLQKRTHINPTAVGSSTSSYFLPAAPCCPPCAATACACRPSSTGGASATRAATCSRTASCPGSPPASPAPSPAPARRGSRTAAAGAGPPQTPSSPPTPPGSHRSPGARTGWCCWGPAGSVRRRSPASSPGQRTAWTATTASWVEVREDDLSETHTDRSGFYLVKTFQEKKFISCEQKSTGKKHWS